MYLNLQFDNSIDEFAIFCVKYASEHKQNKKRKLTRRQGKPIYLLNVSNSTCKTQKKPFANHFNIYVLPNLNYKNLVLKPSQTLQDKTIMHLEITIFRTSKFVSTLQFTKSPFGF